MIPIPKTEYVSAESLDEDDDNFPTMSATKHTPHFKVDNIKMKSDKPVAQNTTSKKNKVS